MIRQANSNDAGLLLLAVLIFSLAFIGMKVSVAEFGTFWTVALRILIALAVLLPYTLWRGLVLPRDAKMWALLSVISLSNVVLPFFALTWAIQWIDVGTAALIFGTVPLLALGASHFTTTDDRMTTRKFGGVVLGLAGVAVVVGRDAFLGLSTQLVAQGVIFLACLGFVTAGILLRKIEGLPPTRLTSIVYSLATPPLLGAALIWGGPLQTQPSAAALGWLAFTGVFASGVGYILRFHLIRTVGYSYFALGMNLLPIVSIGLAALILGEPITVTTLIALALVLSGLALARFGQR